MRFRRYLPWLAATALVFAGTLWLREQAARDAMAARTDALAREERRLAELKAERERVRRELLTAPTRPGGVPAAPEVAAAANPAPVWPPGEWISATAWSNEGNASPRAAMGTFLWAAAGGDLATLRGLLQFDDGTLAHARSWFESLPPGGRALYHTPEDLVAGVTLGAIPRTRAQLSWLQQLDSERAIVGLLMAEPPSATPVPPLIYEPVKGNFPPGFKSQSPYRLVVVNLHRAADGWRINVPATAIDRLAQGLRQPVKK